MENAEIKPGQILVLRKKTNPTSEADSAKTGNTEEQLEKSIKYHIVLEGETVYSIAKLYTQSIDSIVLWNHILNFNIKPGMELIVTKKQVKKTVISDVPKTYTVQPGDTLYSICRKYGISVNEIKKLNGLKADTISTGQVLLLN